LGQGDEFLLRNQEKINPYETQRRQFDPDYSFDRSRQSTALGARNTAEDSSRRRITDRGLQYSEFEPYIDEELDRVYKGVPYGANNASSFFDPNLTDSTLSRVQSDRRTKYTTEANNMLPENFGNTAFGDTADDDVISRILDEQFGSARGVVDRARDRGTLVSSGYDSAIKALGNQRTVGASKLQNVGGNVLTGYRGQLSDIVGEGRRGASNYRLGESFDAGSFKNRLDTKQGELGGRLEGDVRSSFGDEQLFDTSKAMNAGFTEQGAQNTDQSGILGVLANRQKERSAKRGVGNEGSF